MAIGGFERRLAAVARVTISGGAPIFESTNVATPPATEVQNIGFSAVARQGGAGAGDFLLTLNTPLPEAQRKYGGVAMNAAGTFLVPNFVFDASAGQQTVRVQWANPTNQVLADPVHFDVWVEQYPAH